MGQKTTQFHVLLPIEIMFNSWESKYLIGNNHLLEFIAYVYIPILVKPYLDNPAKCSQISSREEQMAGKSELQALFEAQFVHCTKPL